MTDPSADFILQYGQIEYVDQGIYQVPRLSHCLSVVHSVRTQISKTDIWYKYHLTSINLSHLLWGYSEANIMQS